MDERQQQRTKVYAVRFGMGIAAVVGLAVALPLVYFAFLSTLGLLGIGVLAGIAFGAIKALPLLGQKLENKLLGMQMAEARANPVEQLNNRVLAKTQRLNLFKAACASVGGQVLGARRELSERRKKDPSDDYSDVEADLLLAARAHEQMNRTYEEAREALEVFKLTVERKIFRYGIGGTIHTALAAMNPDDAESLRKDMLADEAFRAIDQRVDSAFAALDIECKTINKTEKLQYKSGITIDMTALHIPEAIEVKR